MPTLLDIFTTRGGDGTPAIPAVNKLREQIVTQGLPSRAEMSRLGYGWQVMDTTATAAVVVRPSTVAGLTLWNGSASASPKNYIIDTASAFNLVSTDAIAGWSLWGCVHPSMVAPTADITAIKGYSGNTYAGAAVVDTGATVLDSGWFILSQTGDIGNPGGVTPGNAISTDINGRFIIPPGGGFSINVVASLATWTFTHGIGWYEVPTDLFPLQ